MQKLTKTKNIFSNLANFFINHVWCIIAFLSLLLLITFTLWLSKDSNALSHFSLASSLLSIALAVVIVLYTFYQSNNMGNLISSIPKEMEKAAYIIKEQTKALMDKMDKLDNSYPLYGSSSNKGEHLEASMPTKVEESLSLDLNLSMCSHLTKIAFYCFVKADNLGNRINTKEILEKLDYKLDPPNEIARRTWLTSIFNLISACVGPECTKIGGGGWNITGLDSTFKGKVDESIRKEIECGNSELKTALEKIDDYLAGLKKSYGNSL